MAATSALRPIAVDAYLKEEAAGRAKHEYVGGFVYPMAAGTNRHNLVATNILVALGAELRGKPCRPYNSDTKVRIRQAAQVRFYYPDVSVICRPNPQTDAFQDEPVVIVEVLSDATRRIDEGEKREAYTGIPSVTSYVLVDPDRLYIVRYQKTDQGFVGETFLAPDALLALPEIDATLSVRDVYDGVTFDR